MTGEVDGSGRALLRVRLRHPTSNIETELDAWVDTGFTGELVVPQPQITALGLPLGPAIRARLADGSEV
jgi:predicted aspartyl protease